MGNTESTLPDDQSNGDSEDDDTVSDDAGDHSASSPPKSSAPGPSLERPSFVSIGGGLVAFGLLLHVGSRNRTGQAFRQPLG